MRTLTALAVLILAGSMAIPRAAEAQFEGLLAGITDISVNSACRVSGGENRIRDCYDASSFGFEILWRLREIPRNGTGVASPAGRKKTGTTETMRRDPDGRVVFTEAVDTYAVVPGEDKTVTKWLILELALGYSQFAGIKADVPSYELAGTVREIPALAVYASFSGYMPVITPYVGVRTGIVDIQNFQAYDNLSSDTLKVYNAVPRALQIGTVAGFAVGSPRFLLRVEAAYNRREFHSLQWSSATVPARFPRRLSFSGTTITTGLQVSLRDPKP